LVALCRELNHREARYIVIGGFAVIFAGHARLTGDIDLLIDTSLENESRVYQALESLPDKAVRELKPGETSQYVVVRVGDEIIVDLMKSACGIEYAEAARDIVYREVLAEEDQVGRILLAVRGSFHSPEQSR
jgi:predicted nucleotidyltransferase